MTIFGIGHKAGILTVVYLTATLYLSFVFPIFKFPPVLDSIREIKGIFLLVAGLIILVVAAAQLIYAYKNKKLAKTGLYRLVANPLYANATVFIIPGIALFVNSWLVLTTSLVLYFLYRKMVVEEYSWLKKTFGKEYEDYYKSILIKWL